MAAHHATTNPGPAAKRVGPMPFNISFYQDQVMADGVSDMALEPLPRVVYVRDGEVAVNGQILRAGESAARSSHGSKLRRRRSREAPAPPRCPNGLDDSRPQRSCA